MKLLLLTFALLLSGCASKGHWLDNVVCPDPPPAHPEVVIGSTPCMREGK